MKQKKEAPKKRRAQSVRSVAKKKPMTSAPVIERSEVESRVVDVAPELMKSTFESLKQMLYNLQEYYRGQAKIIADRLDRIEQTVKAHQG